MEKVTILKPLSNCAFRIFSFHEEISRKEFDKACNQYFSNLKNMDLSTKTKVFSNTYYSKEGISWFILKEFKYFTMSFNVGSYQEDYYYGKKIIM